MAKAVGFPLTPYKRSKARDLYNIFNVINSLSWYFLSGNIITLFAMRLNASSTVIGLLNALIYVSYFCMPLGQMLVKKLGLVRVMAIAWTGRVLVMLPAVAAPFFVMAGNYAMAIALTIIGVSLFNLLRGVGMVSNNPVLAFIAEGPDAGSYMTQIQIFNNAVAMVTYLITAVVLGANPPVFVYSILFSLGIGLGIFNCYLTLRLPEPVDSSQARIESFFSIIRQSFKEHSFSLFISILLLVSLASGVARLFVVVYAQEALKQNDGLVSLYNVFGGLGTLIIGLFIRFLVDRVGSKPLFILCTLGGLLSMIPPLVFSPLNPGLDVTDIIYLSVLFFVMNFAFIGAENVGQTYFLSLIPKQHNMELSVLYWLVYGLAGAAGSFLAGVFMDALSAFGLSSLLSYKILFGILIVITALTIFFQRRLAAIGALSFKDSLGVIFSPRDLRAITLLEKLDKTSGDAEEALISELHDTPSQLAMRSLVKRISSPRFDTRLESIRSLEAMKRLTPEAENALIEDISNNPYTSAYYSARVLGEHKVERAAPLLRELILSDDYMLAGASMFALAKIGDDDYRETIEKTILSTRNPRIQLMGAEALGIYKSPKSLPVLFEIMHASLDTPPYLRDSVSLAMASILNIAPYYYKLLVRFLEDEPMAPSLASDEAEQAVERYKNAMKLKSKRKSKKFEAISKAAAALPHTVSSFMDENRSGAGALSKWIMELPNEYFDEATALIISDVVFDSEIVKWDRLRLLIVQWCCRCLRLWTDKAKRQ
jgi:Na+/melibiose symporter-like transporter